MKVESKSRRTFGADAWREGLIERFEEALVLLQKAFVAVAEAVNATDGLRVQVTAART